MLASRHIPFQKGDQRASASQVCRQLRPCYAHEIFDDYVGVVRDYDATTFPGNPVEIRDGPLHIQAAAVGPDRFADGSAPVNERRRFRVAGTGAVCTNRGWPGARVRAF